MGDDVDLVSAYGHRVRAPATHQVNAGIAFGLLAQQRLDQHLLHPVRQLRRGPKLFAVVAKGAAVYGLLARRNAKARQLAPAQGGAVHHVLRVVGSQPQLPHLMGKAAAAVMLHGAGRCGVGFWKVGRAHVFFKHHTGHTTAAQFNRQHQARRAATDNRHVGGPVKGIRVG